MTMKKIIETEKAPKAIGPYSQANEKNNTIYVSGQLPINPQTGAIESDNVLEQTRQSLENAGAVLVAAGASFDDVVKVTVLLDDIEDFAQMNTVYSTFFTSNYPARAAYEVAKLPLGAKVEIEMIAEK